MVVNSTSEKRPRGRPQVRADEETRGIIIEAANAQFQACGYASASINVMAQQAGVSTKTLYRLFPTKGDLFTSVVADRIDRFFVALDQPSLAAASLQEGLERLLTVYGMLTLSPETITMTRLVVGESDRFPEIASAFYQRAILPTNEAMEAWLRRQCDAGRIALEDVHAACGMLRGMMIMEPQRTAMLGQGQPPGGSAIAERAKACAALFLKGCKVEA
ncbi:TetR/AcrR family transcriptional regulator [Mesorhizobium sp. VK23B]|uniref:TetR/AcrR family transcriptional regulator n=1 Tax=Mesorhizobium dulcispinae TaxID=3072316 RepID=A0ABU4XPI8_9HYPH|nr:MULTISPECIES: TetR/AcrR family transcriptional regulator [unclassified Mesorhizobium]MDX8470275.1 TetR/AcrR family transcriptional regulator [Mesorhizobium sp. VK23B]MDX8476670.1 TetR/AcrR family transcriptional regulator [Mesorhizobium sp. VK23A]